MHAASSSFGSLCDNNEGARRLCKGWHQDGQGFSREAHAIKINYFVFQNRDIRNNLLTIFTTHMQMHFSIHITTVSITHTHSDTQSL